MGDGRTLDRRMDEPWTDGCIIDGWMYYRQKRLMDGWIDELQTDGGNLDRWKDACTLNRAFIYSIWMYL